MQPVVHDWSLKPGELLSSDCCARAASAQILVEPAITIAASHCLPQGQDYANKVRLQQGFATGEMGLSSFLQSSKSRSLMSALGQKQT